MGILVAKVVPDSLLLQLDKPFDYAIPEGMTLLPGQQVEVPLGGGTCLGYVLEVWSPKEYAGQLKEVIRLVSPVPMLTADIWQLARQLADRSCAAAASLLRLALPPRRVRVEKKFLEGSPVFFDPTHSLDKADAPGEADDLGGADAPGGASPSVFDSPSAAETLPVRTGAPERLDELIAPGARTCLSFALGVDDKGIQAWAHTFAAAAKRCYQQGRSAILAVPDHRCQRQLLQALKLAECAEEVVVLNSGQKPTERYQSFLECLQKRPHIIVGNRSVLYAPAYSLGLLAIWDEADYAFAEPRTPCPQARDVALIRQKILGCSLLFGVFVPSMSLMWLQQKGWLQAWQSEALVRPNLFVPDEPGRIPGKALQQLHRALEKGPVLVQVPQKGYINSFVCASCRLLARCQECGGPLAHTGESVQCRWCAKQPVWHCQDCGGQRLAMLSRGSERTAFELTKAFAHHQVLVSTADSPQEDIEQKPMIVVSTAGAEPAAAGGYQAALILDAGDLAARPGFEAAYSAIRVWAHAAALLKPGAPLIIPGIGQPLAKAISGWQLKDYLAAELQHRIDLHLPPAARVFSLSGYRQEIETAQHHLLPLPGVRILGPLAQGNGIFRIIVTYPPAHNAKAQALLRQLLLTAAKRRANMKIKYDDTEILNEF